MQISRKIDLRIALPQSVIRPVPAARPARGKGIYPFVRDRIAFEKGLNDARRVQPTDGVADKYPVVFLKIFDFVRDRRADVRARGVDDFNGMPRALRALPDTGRIQLCGTAAVGASL